MKKYLTVKELQFFDSLFKRLGKEVNLPKVPRILFRDKDLILAGDFFIYQNAYSGIKTLDDRWSEEEQFRTISLFDYYPIFSKLSKAEIPGYSGKEVSVEFLTDRFLNLLSDDLLQFRIDPSEPVPPYVYSPVFCNQTMPCVPLYVLDEDQRYEVLSVIFAETQN